MIAPGARGGVWACCATVALALSVAHVSARTAASAPANTPAWAAAGGEVGLRWNRDLAQDIGLRIHASTGRLADMPGRNFARFALRGDNALAFRIDHGRFSGFDGGGLQARGGYVIDAPDGRIDLTDFRLRPRANDAFAFDLVAADGTAWFYVDNLMYEKAGQGGRLSIPTMDVRISAQLAARLKQDVLAGWAIADMEVDSAVIARGSDVLAATAACDVNSGANCHFSGSPAPDGSTYQTDLFMKSFTPQYTRCSGCSGADGSGTVVFTPSSSLKNNVNAGTLATTIAGQGALGTSSALWAADVPWYSMFSGNFPPYANDQHPYLVWNMYRINADGSIEQIGRSGVKHAFLTINAGTTCAYTQGHVLGASCEDTYSTGNNDDHSRLGPRSEIIPATNQWGRCGSIYDANCDGANDYPAVGAYDYRLRVNEAQLGGPAASGASFLFESWYLAREDIDIHNSMGSVATTQTWTGSVWSMVASAYKLGPAIDRWVDPAAPAANSDSSELASAEGHVKLAVKVTDNGDGSWRYDYAVMNLDYARAVTTGSEPNLRVLGAHGFDRFSVPLPPGAQVSATNFRDGDLLADNDWSVDSSGGHVSWTAPAGATLDWATLFSFSVTVDSPPVAIDADLHVAQSGTPSDLTLATLGPAVPPQAGASVTPGSLSVNVEAGSTATAAFALDNSGAAGSTLQFATDVAPTDCASAQAVAWLGVTPAAGSLAQGAASVSVTATVDASTLAAGTYSAFVCVRSNDPAQPVIAVPVDVSVSAAPAVASVVPSSLTISVVQGSSASATFDVHNSGAAASSLEYAVAFSSVAPADCSTPDTPAWLVVTPASGMVSGGTSATITLDVDAATLAPGTRTLTACVQTNDAAHALLEVGLSVVVSPDPPDVIFIDGFDPSQ